MLLAAIHNVAIADLSAQGMSSDVAGGTDVRELRATAGPSRRTRLSRQFPIPIALPLAALPAHYFDRTIPDATGPFPRTRDVPRGH
jgi:hypothetical protein